MSDPTPMSSAILPNSHDQLPPATQEEGEVGDEAIADDDNDEQELTPDGLATDAAAQPTASSSKSKKKKKSKGKKILDKVVYVDG